MVRIICLGERRLTDGVGGGLGEGAGGGLDTSSGGGGLREGKGGGGVGSGKGGGGLVTAAGGGGLKTADIEMRVDELFWSLLTTVSFLSSGLVSPVFSVFVSNLSQSVFKANLGDIIALNKFRHTC